MRFRIKQLWFGYGNRTILSIHFITEMGLLPWTIVDFEFEVFLAFRHNSNRISASDFLKWGHQNWSILINIHIAQKLVAVILNIQSQGVHDNFHDARRPQFVGLIGDIVYRIQTQVAECHRWGALCTILWTDKNWWFSHIELRLTLSIQVSKTGTYNHWEDKPVPVVGTRHKQAIPLDTITQTSFFLLFGSRFSELIFLNYFLHDKLILFNNYWFFVPNADSDYTPPHNTLQI